MTFHTLLQVMWYASQVPQVVIQHSLSSSCVNDSCFYLAMGGIVTRLLLLLAGDVEENPVQRRVNQGSGYINHRGPSRSKASIMGLGP
jgi:hypothetical protein